MKDTWVLRKCLFVHVQQFWSGLTADVNNMANNCETCPQTSTKPWSKLASDVFDITGKSYIVIANYYSRFPYVKELPNITSRSIINVFKTLFADHGFCDTQTLAPHMCHINLKFSLETAPSNISPAVQCTPNLMNLLNQW